MSFIDGLLFITLATRPAVGARNGFARIRAIAGSAYGSGQQQPDQYVARLPASAGSALTPV
jgi:hypothetical protein